MQSKRLLAQTFIPLNEEVTVSLCYYLIEPSLREMPYLVEVEQSGGMRDDHATCALHGNRDNAVRFVEWIAGGNVFPATLEDMVVDWENRIDLSWMTQ